MAWMSCWTPSWCSSSATRASSCWVILFVVSSSKFLFEFVQRAVAVQHGRDTRIRLAPCANRRKELTVLQLDAVHRDVDVRNVDLLVLAVVQIVVTCKVRA